MATRDDTAYTPREEPGRDLGLQFRAYRLGGDMGKIKHKDWIQMKHHFTASHPEILWNKATEPSRTFVDKIRRDHLKTGKVLNYTLNQLWVQADGVVSKAQKQARTRADLEVGTSGFKTREVPDALSGLHRIRGFLYALDMLGIMPLGKETGLKYLRELDNFSRRYPHLEHVGLIDQKIRTEVDERIRGDSNLKWPQVFEDVLKECRGFWATVPYEVLSSDRRPPETDRPEKRGRSMTPDEEEKEKMAKSERRKGRRKRASSWTRKQQEAKAKEERTKRRRRNLQGQ
jgi:hypothetical protein